MAPRRKKTVRRRSRAVSALSVLESYMYANILSQGLAGTSPIGLITGATDLSSSSTIIPGSYQYGEGFQYQDTVTGGEALSLGDMVSAPGLALATISDNFMSNYQSMAVQSIVTGLTFKFGKKLLRRPISSVNRTLMKPLGIGIKL